MQPRTLLKNLINSPIEKWKDNLSNNFELSVFKKFPEIVKIKQELYNQGAIYASMSGSGSSVYGIFDKNFEKKFNFDKCFVWQDEL
jgi:4-diphosphocytidyl-2-C-methyl-D-erythritol kinase